MNYLDIEVFILGVFFVDENQSLKLYSVLTRATQSINKKIEEDIRSYGLNLTEFGVMELLFHKGDQAIQKIGEKILIASSSITYVVDKLEKKNFLIRKSCPNDKRVTYASLTELGSQFIVKNFPKHQLLIEQIFEKLSEEEKKIMIEQLKIIGKTNYQ